jgi:hypothetical protein
MAIWLTQGDLEGAMTIATVAAIFDDSNSGNLNQAAIALCIKRAEAQIQSWLVAELGPAPFSDTVLQQLSDDPLLYDAALLQAIIYAYDRDPAYVRANGKERIDRNKTLVDMMERILDARQRPPTVATPPANVGGVVVDNAARLYVDSPGSPPGNRNSGDY